MSWFPMTSTARQQSVIEHHFVQLHDDIVMAVLMTSVFCLGNLYKKKSVTTSGKGQSWSVKLSLLIESLKLNLDILIRGMWTNQHQTLLSPSTIVH